MSPHLLLRRSGRRLLAAFAVGALASTLLVGPLARSAADAAMAAPARPGPTTTVTLITGDVVSVTETAKGEYATDVRRPGGARGGVHVQTIGDDLFVFPAEVMPYVAAGTLDRRLFDVTLLIENGYDDQHSDGIPLIVGYADAKGAAKPAPVGTTKLRPLTSVRGSAVKAAKQKMRHVWEALTPRAVTFDVNPKPVLADGIAKVWLDGKVRVNLADSTAHIGAPQAWSAGYDGKGVKVAVLDTGVDLNHPDLAGRVATTASFVPGETVADGHGHGTHVASTVAGSGAASGGQEKGVAPGADLIVGKVLADGGYGEDSWIIAGMEWAAAQGARVVNMSLGSNQPTDGSDPMSAAVDQLTADKGTLFVVAAGNSWGEAWITPPGAADAALTVTAIDSADRLADFASRGPRFGDYSLKPDLAAPGVDILAARSGGNAADGYYTSMSGTSMATPHVAGAAAILAQRHPEWRAGQLKDALMSTAARLDGYTAYQVGSGRVDIPAGLNAAVTATGSAYFGFQEWGRVSPTPIDRTVTYTNTGDSPVSLQLDVTGHVAGGPYDSDPHADEGTPAPGMFTLSASTLVVPAHGTASVTATAHPQLGAPGRRYLGEIAATGGAGAATRTTLGMFLEEERHDLTFSVKDTNGEHLSVWLEVQRLGEQGLLGTPGTEPDPVYVPAPPGVTLAALLRQRQDDLRDAERAVTDLVDQFRSPDLRHDVIEVLTDVADVRRRFFQIQEAARHEVLSMVVPNLRVVPHRENVAEIAGMKRGVRYRALLDREALLAQDMQADVRASLAAGQEIRVVDEVPVKMMIVDGHTALLPLHSSASPTSVLVHRSGLLAVLIAFFEAEWARAFPLEPADADDTVTENQLDDLDRQVLALLLSGLTVHAVANQLCLSLRTVHRRIRQLMTKAGVESRIQLGWAAARNGWA
ncbi:S8 family serine peptidase [Catellatospora coxensis]|uniref:HTH luxR-type domain-containing protein n=1 Tax=Catellatospora coxensis TaxID=310354 RepID=A0A8J3P4I6_9ACTN|nr:S8 family serine peptidase [Catellatospora coxensis]GIG03736.1 hypothetical protein Cco03nite_04360 [Catellatospora coxensis]